MFMERSRSSILNLNQKRFQFFSEMLIQFLDKYRRCSVYFKPAFHSITSLPPAKNYDREIIFSHSFAAKEISSGPPVVENFLLFTSPFVHGAKEKLIKFFCWRKFLPATTKYVSGKRALDLNFEIFSIRWMKQTTVKKKKPRYFTKIQKRSIHFASARQYQCVLCWPQCETSKNSISRT